MKLWLDGLRPVAYGYEGAKSVNEAKFNHRFIGKRHFLCYGKILRKTGMQLDAAWHQKEAYDGKTAF